MCNKKSTSTTMFWVPPACTEVPSLPSLQLMHLSSPSDCDPGYLLLNKTKRFLRRLLTRQPHLFYQAFFFTKMSSPNSLTLGISK